MYFDIEEDELDKEPIALVRKHEFEPALHFWLKQIQSNPKRSASYHNVAVLYHAQEKLELAEQFYQKAIEIQSKELYHKNISELTETLAEHRPLQKLQAVRIVKVY